MIINTLMTINTLRLCVVVWSLKGLRRRQVSDQRNNTDIEAIPIVVDE